MNSLQERLRALRKRLSKEKLGAFVLVTHENSNKNVRYLSGFGGSDAVLVVTQKRAVAYVDSRYTQRFQKEAANFLLVESPARLAPAHIIAHLLAAAKVPAPAHVGFESDRVSVHALESWHSTLSHTLVPLATTIETLRQQKDAEELREITLACRMASKSFAEMVPLIRPGLREDHIAREIDRILLKNGAVAPSFATIVASGPNAAIPHHEPGSRRLRAGETVIIDYGCISKGGYCSDITRTVFVPGKKPDDELAKIYTIVRSAQNAAAKKLTAGVTWKAYDTAAREHIASHGYGDYFTHSVGHSLGIDVHDPYDYKHDAIQLGTVLTNEPGIYLPGKGGVRIEDDFHITVIGAKKLTSVPYNPYV